MERASGTKCDQSKPNLESGACPQENFCTTLFRSSESGSPVRHYSQSVAAPRGDWGNGHPNPKSRQQLSKENGVRLVGYTFRLKNYVEIPPSLSDFSELAPPLLTIEWKRRIVIGKSVVIGNFSNTELKYRKEIDLCQLTY